MLDLLERLQRLLEAPRVLRHQALPQPHPVGQEGRDGQGQGPLHVVLGLGVVALPAGDGRVHQQPLGQHLPAQGGEVGQQGLGGRVVGGVHLGLGRLDPRPRPGGRVLRAGEQLERLQRLGVGVLPQHRAVAHQHRRQGLALLGGPALRAHPQPRQQGEPRGVGGQQLQQHLERARPPGVVQRAEEVALAVVLERQGVQPLGLGALHLGQQGAQHRAHQRLALPPARAVAGRLQQRALGLGEGGEAAAQRRLEKGHRHGGVGLEREHRQRLEDGLEGGVLAQVAGGLGLALGGLEQHQPRELAEVAPGLVDQRLHPFGRQLGQPVAHVAPGLGAAGGRERAVAEAGRGLAEGGDVGHRELAQQGLEPQRQVGALAPHPQRQPAELPLGLGPQQEGDPLPLDGFLQQLLDLVLQGALQRVGLGGGELGQQRLEALPYPQPLPDQVELGRHLAPQVHPQGAGQGALDGPQQHPLPRGRPPDHHHLHPLPGLHPPHEAPEQPPLIPPQRPPRGLLRQLAGEGRRLEPHLLEEPDEHLEQPQLLVGRAQVLVEDVAHRAGPPPALGQHRLEPAQAPPPPPVVLPREVRAQGLEVFEPGCSGFAHGVYTITPMANSR